MEYIDYYKILGIDKSAGDAEIKKAYRKLARKYHPDLNPGDKEAENKFKEINEANEVLSHLENRKKYDQYGKDWKHAEEFEKAKKQQQYNRGAPQEQQGSFSGDEFSDFFSSMFGGRPSGSRESATKFRGQDYHSELHLTLEDVFTSHQRTLTVNGKNIRISIPAGVKNEQTIKIRGYGGEGMNGGPSGDLTIKFIISNSTKFKRVEENLYSNVDLNLYDAILGREIVIDTFDGKVKLKIKPGTQNGIKVKLTGKGFPLYKQEGKYGDLFVTFNIIIPENITEEEIKIFEELEKIRSHGKS